MGGSRTPGVVGLDDFDCIVPSVSPGPTGRHDAGDPDRVSETGDTPGVVGVADGAASVARRASATGPIAVRSRRAALSPSAFADRYHRTRVSYLDPATGLARGVVVDVHLYNNRSSGTRADMREKAWINGMIRSELRRARGLTLIDVNDSHPTMVMRAFCGKGTPEEFGVTLTHALRYGIQTGRVSPAGLQGWCDGTARLGLDCSGFVNAYFTATGRLEQPMEIGSYERRGRPRRGPADIQDRDVLIWRRIRGRHIAVVDRILAGDPLRMVVVESSSSGGGLTSYTYAVRDRQGDNLFLVDRGFARQDGSRAESWVSAFGVPAYVTGMMISAVPRSCADT